MAVEGDIKMWSRVPTVHVVVAKSLIPALAEIATVTVVTPITVEDTVAVALPKLSVVDVGVPTKAPTPLSPQVRATLDTGLPYSSVTVAVRV